MSFAAISNIRDLIEISVAGISVMGGVMAYYSGRAARRAVAMGAPGWKLADEVNVGLSEGFGIGLPVALAVSILLAIL